jgi:hypothetical protein
MHGLLVCSSTASLTPFCAKCVSDQPFNMRIQTSIVLFLSALAVTATTDVRKRQAAPETQMQGR